LILPQNPLHSRQKLEAGSWNLGLGMGGTVRLEAERYTSYTAYSDNSVKILSLSVFAADHRLCV
jgi:hypothetical protein